MARKRPRCAACEEPIAAMHHPGCRILLLASARRVTKFVTREDTERTNCGCPELLVQQFGEHGHRADDRKPDAARPPIVSRLERILGYTMIALALTLFLVAEQLADYRLGTHALILRSCAVGLALAVTTAFSVRRALAPPVWPGMRVVEHGEPGRIVRCPHCTGEGVMFAPAYPPLPGPRTYQRTR